MDRSNHYEVAFESYLQHHRLCYVAVDETRRALLGDTLVKSLDFIVFGFDGAPLRRRYQGPTLSGRPAESTPARLGVLVGTRRHRRTGTLVHDGR